MALATQESENGIEVPLQGPMMRAPRLLPTGRLPRTAQTLVANRSVCPQGAEPIALRHWKVAMHARFLLARRSYPGDRAHTSRVCQRRFRQDRDHQPSNWRDRRWQLDPGYQPVRSHHGAGAAPVRFQNLSRSCLWVRGSSGWESVVHVTKETRKEGYP